MKRKLPRYSFLILYLISLTLFIQIGSASEQIVVHFLYFNPTTDPNYCETCQTWKDLYQDFLNKNATVTGIQRDYAEVAFEWTDITSQAGLDKKQFYNVALYNSLVVDGQYITKIEGEFDEPYIRSVIDAELGNTKPPSPPTKLILPVLASAFVFGFFETFSPCLLALLSFILSYSLGDSEEREFKRGFMQVMTFGTGFIIAALTVGATIGLVFMALMSFQAILTLVICAVAIVFGLSLLVSPFKRPVDTKPMLQKLTRKYLLSYGGIVLLGFLFYFLDPCLAPIFFATLPLLSMEGLPLILLVFGLGVLVPFVLVGILAGSISKLVRTTYRHKSKIRAVSGIILIAYASYIVLTYLL